MRQLELYLSKKDKKWQTTREVKTLSALKHLGYARRLQRIGLSDDELRLLGDNEDDENIPVHLVVHDTKPKKGQKMIFKSGGVQRQISNKS